MHVTPTRRPSTSRAARTRRAAGCADRSLGATAGRARRLGILLGSLIAALLVVPPAIGQDWGREDDDWGPPATDRRDDRDWDRYPTNGGGLVERVPGWSFRGGIGFTADPGTLLLNFELPYAFDRWVSAGPMLQVGIDDHDLIVAPTANVIVRVPDLPGEALDRVHPYALVGIGFAVIEDDNRRGDNSSAGFLIDFGVGLEVQLSEHLYLGSQMMFNFLPEETLDEDFFYSWQVGGVRIAF